MKLALFAAALSMYAYLCYLGIRGYCLVAVRLHEGVQHRKARVGLLYAWFLIFVALEIPFGILFPAWLDARWDVLVAGPTSTTLLILLGCVALSVAAWLGLKGKEARRLNQLQKANYEAGTR